MGHAIPYAYEKFMGAVDSLATSDAPLRQRLLYAFDQLHRLQLRDFGDYPELAQAFEEIDASYRTVSTGPEGGAAASIGAMDDGEAVALSKRIFSLFLKIAAEDERLEGKRTDRR